MDSRSSKCAASLGSCRVVFNEALSLQKARTRRAKRNLAMPGCASCLPSGATARPCHQGAQRLGWPMRQRIHCSRRSRTWSGPSRTSSNNGQISLVSGRRDSLSAFAIQTPNRSNSINPIAESFSPTRLDSLPQQSESDWQAEKHYHQSLLRQMVCKHPDRARD